MKVRAAYERLCTGDAPASVATCTALRAEVDKAGVPGTVGWSGVMAGAPDDGTKAVRVFAVDPRGPAAAAGVRTGDLIVAVDGQPFSEVGPFLKHAQTLRVHQAVRLRLVRGEQILDVGLKLAEAPKAAPKLNAQRTEARGYSLMKQLNGLSGAGLTFDRIRIGEAFAGILEESDATSDWGKREDCLEIADPGARNLIAVVTPNGAPMRVHAMQGQCAFGAPSTSAAGADGKKDFGINFATQAGAKTYLMVSGPASPLPYRVVIREQTAKETLAWREQVRQRQVAAEQRRRAEEQAAADRRQMWGAALQGLVVGFSGAEMPAMREDGSLPNMLETLNAGNAALERKNAEGAARLNATIARAQAQADIQRREQAALAAADAEAKTRQQTAKVAQDRQAATIAFGNARAGIEQKLREAATRGDAQQLQLWRERLRENDALAGQFGVTEQVRQYAQTKAGTGVLGQTPVSGLPAPVAAPSGQADRTELARQEAGRGQVCLDGRVIGAHNLRCEEPPKASPAGGRQASGVANGGASGQSGAGNSGPPPSRTGTGQPPRTGAAVEYVQRPEGVTLCELKGPQAQFKNWRCEGPLQMNYVNFEKANWTSAMLSTCGGKGPVRDLGTAGGYRAFGCGHAIDAAFHKDVPALFGVEYVAGRISYRCRKDRTSCTP
ncbi:PDZ domain-containing protein [Phenylobacterium sp. J367]|uniref:PDZ domain-containing protein n=1 Tax=Phenylobacterium sp. J367 TaxID=2898435 RepID=UPI0027E35944|nr:PDZ domain-containing protein [Phenylobacterium sp. J367]